MEFREHERYITEEGRNATFQFILDNILYELSLCIPSGIFGLFQMHDEMSRVLLPVLYYLTFLGGFCIGVFLRSLSITSYNLYKEQENKVRSLEKQLPSGLCKEFQDYVSQLTKCICDIIDYSYSIDPEIGEAKHPEYSGEQLTEKFNAILDKLDTLSGGRNIPRFRVEIKCSHPIAYYQKLETFSSVLDWIDFWRKPFINNPDSPVDTKSDIKDEIFKIIINQEKVYLDKYRDKLIVIHEATNS